ncbi:hypothetical protein ACOCJ7_02630 [Knoellia sp. CPCC 206453]|uniref:hypothetical protein n=1 Tax=Knoellia pratensis TaxID=3404796 RepID=UPI003607FBED
MSYDFVALVPEAAGGSDDEVLAAASRLTEDESAVETIDPRISAFHAELATIVDSLPDDEKWISVWPLTPTAKALFVPVPYPSADDALLTLLRLAARHGLVLADLSSTSVDHPAPGLPVSVRGGDGARLGALTRDRLTALVQGVGGEEPFLVLDTGERFAQIYRESDGSFLLEHADDSGHMGTTVAGADEAATHLWKWLAADPDFGAGLTFTPVPR